MTKIAQAKAMIIGEIEAGKAADKIERRKNIRIQPVGDKFKNDRCSREDDAGQQNFIAEVDNDWGSRPVTHKK